MDELQLIQCESCEGSGKIFSDECKFCQGSGILAKNSQVLMYVTLDKDNNPELGEPKEFYDLALKKKYEEMIVATNNPTQSNSNSNLYNDSSNNNQRNNYENKETSLKNENSQKIKSKRLTLKNVSKWILSVVMFCNTILLMILFQQGTNWYKVSLILEILFFVLLLPMNFLTKSFMKMKSKVITYIKEPEDLLHYLAKNRHN